MPAAAVPAPPYPDLVRSRIAVGWDPERAATEPYCAKARLTAEDVARVRASTESTRALAGELGITPRHVRAIRAGRAWKGV